jgi:hypothetical protein
VQVSFFYLNTDQQVDAALQNKITDSLEADYTAEEIKQVLEVAGTEPTEQNETQTTKQDVEKCLEFYSFLFVFFCVLSADVENYGLHKIKFSK